MTWQTGESGNKNGRPKGTGKHQREAQVKAHERVANLRLQNALDAIDAKERVIDEYLSGCGQFAFLMDNGAQLVEFDTSDIEDKKTVSLKPKKLKMTGREFKFR